MHSKLYENVRKVKFFVLSYFINYEYILQTWSMEIPERKYVLKKIYVDGNLNPQNSNSYRIWCLVTIISHCMSQNTPGEIENE